MRTKYTEVMDKAFEIFLKRMPTTPLTDESRKGYLSTMEQAIEIAELFVEKQEQEAKRFVEENKS